MAKNKKTIATRKFLNKILMTTYRVCHTWNIHNNDIIKTTISRINTSPKTILKQCFNSQTRWCVFSYK